MSTPESAGAVPRYAPRDPVAFFHEQKRNRRATWRMSALCAIAAFLMGIPLTLVLTPLLYAVTMVVADIVNYFSPLPPQFWQAAGDTARLAYRVLDVLINQRGTVDPQEVAVVAALVFLPGIVFALALWIGVRLLFRHGGVGGTIASINARAPNPSDLRELQLVDVVQEMAIAAGLPAPKVMLIDSPGANAAAIGTSPDDAHIVLSRRLIDDLDRDQLQAVIGDLVASVGNGDLRIAFSVTSVFETCGLIITLINAPFGRQARSTLWRVIRYPLRRGGADSKSVDAAEVAELLADTIDTDSSDIDRFFNSSRAGLIRKALRVATFPFLFTNIAVELTLWFFLSVLLGPCMALLWRTRRYLADCGAVELTRNPDALAAALQRLSQDNTAIAGGSWANHLFVVNPAGDRSLDGPAIPPEQVRKALETWRASASAATAPAAATSPIVTMPGANMMIGMRKEIMSTVMAAARGDAAAAARMQAFVMAMGGPAAFGLHDMPNPSDLLLAQRGDRAAIARLRMLQQSRQQQPGRRRSQTGLQHFSFVGFHPPLKRRELRLQRMGAHFTDFGKRRGTGASIALIILYVILAPLIAVAGAAMLAAIVMMIGLNLVFLSLWLTVIHWAFAQDWASIARSFIAFVQQVATAISNRR